MFSTNKLNINKENSTGLPMLIIPITLVSTLTSEIITLPICTVKTIYQNSPKSITTVQVFKNIYKSSGMSGFFRASAPAILSQLISTTSKFTIYEFIKEKRKTQKDDLFNNALNGMTGGIIGSFITHPFDVWKNFSQRKKSIEKYIQRCKQKNILIAGMYRGYAGSLTKNIALYAGLFSLNDFYQVYFKSIWISAPMTTLTLTCIIQPFDNYKTVRMAGGRPLIGYIKNPIGMYRGMHLMLARSIPSFAITMYFIQTLKQMCGLVN